MSNFYVENSNIGYKTKCETLPAEIRLKNMNLEEYNKQKYQNWVEKINLDNIQPNCPKCSSEIQEIPNSATGNPKQAKVECPKCKYKGIKIL